MALGVVEGAQFGCSLAVLGVGGEHRPGTFTLGANYTSHPENTSKDNL